MRADRISWSYHTLINRKEVPRLIFHEQYNTRYEIHRETWSKPCQPGEYNKARSYIYIWKTRWGVIVECVQADNSFEVTKRFFNSKKDIPTHFEKTASRLGIRHKLIRPYTPRHNGKVERSHREDQKQLCDSHRFFSPADFGVQLAAHQNRSNLRPMRPLNWLSPLDALLSFSVQFL